MTVDITMPCPTCEGDINCHFTAHKGSRRSTDPGEPASLELDWPKHDCMTQWDRATTEKFQSDAEDAAEQWIIGYEEYQREGPSEPEDREDR